MDFGVYVHVPFCRRRCPYCTFYTVERPAAAAPMQRFLAAVAQEWQQRVVPRLERGDRARTLYVGGGTPSDLPAAALRGFLRRLAATLPGGLRALDEVTVECNPESATPELLDGLRAVGVDRISLGVQALDGRDLGRLGRPAGPKEVRAALAAVASRFATWNVDLILGVPGSDAARLVAALEELHRRGAPHLSFYCLELPAARARLLGDPQREDPDAFKAGLYELAASWVEAHGYEHYEISNAARPGHRARHNSAYWDGREYVGLGPGAHSFAAGVRSANRSGLERYVLALQAGAAPESTSERLTPGMRWREEVLLGLRRRDGIDVVALRLDGQRGLIDRLSRGGLAWFDQGRLGLTVRGWMISDSIVLQLVAAGCGTQPGLTSPGSLGTFERLAVTGPEC
ncbi:MAG: coproporphyrinogen-III oxidase family protein [Candidatus Krumholzibacteriia bacterium]